MKNGALAVAIFLASAALAGAQTIPDLIPEASPARPTLSTPETLTPVGYLQFESGMLAATSSPEFDTRIGINQVTKLTVLRRLELFAQTEPYVHSRYQREKQTRPGEVFVGAQSVLVPAAGAVPAIALSYVRRLYESPAPELDLGTFRQSGTILISHDVKGFHYNTNFVMTEEHRTGGGGPSMHRSYPFPTP